MEATLAILLRTTKLTETSLIVTWFTASYGRIQTVAKGARRPNSRFAGMLDLFYECEIQITPSRKSELHTLREAVLIDPNEGLRQEYARVALASYYVELLELVTEPDHAAPELHDLLRRACRYLNQKAASTVALLHFESELVRLLGIQGQANVSPVVAIGRAYQRLPKARANLLNLLAKNPSRQP